MLVRYLFVLANLVWFGFIPTAKAETSSANLQIYSSPEWIKPQDPIISKEIPENEIQDGVYYLLSDHQTRVSDKNGVESYSHYSEKVVNQNGLPSVSNISVSYDPAYEIVKWHQLSIIRDGKIISKEQGLKVNLLQREKELENSIYNGLLTFNLIVSDLRVGDVVDYSYSVLGSNPIYGKHFAETEYAQWVVPVGNAHFYLDWRKTAPLFIKLLETDVQPIVVKSNDYTSYELSVENVKAKTTNSQVPSWYNPYARYYFSDTDSWKEIIKWAIPLYEPVIKSSPEIQKIVTDITTEGGSTSHQVASALHYVQNDIRYLGVEMGVNSHKPSLAADTLGRRYGDCKDKAVLLITILRELGVNAAPALVNTKIRRELINRLPSINAFDHVIVYTKIDGKVYWIDPTREYQKGDLEVTPQANYSYGLVISNEFDDLVKMNTQPISHDYSVENIDASGALDSSATYTVSTQYFGVEAEDQRSNFLGSNIKEKSNQYLNFYKEYYDHIRVTEDIATQDNPLTNVFMVNEHYTIDKIWNDKEKPKYKATFYGNAIVSAFPKPKEIVRTAPYYVGFKETKEIIKVKLDGADWEIKDERFEEKNEYFEFNSVVLFDKETAQLTLEYFYRTLSDTVPADKINDYLMLRKKVIDQVEYSITETVGGVNDSSNAFLWWCLAFVVYILILIYTILDWYNDKTRFDYLSKSKFYPISLLKFISLSVVTLGLYNSYWFYRNWSYIRRADSSDIMPFWRSVFSGFWVYSFYNRLVLGEESKDVKFLPHLKSAAVGAGVLYLAASLATNIDRYGFVFMLLVPILLVPFALHILHIPQENDFALKNNSRWKLRHFFLVTVSVPMFVLLMGMQIGVVNAAQVMKGSQLMSYDVKFFQRKKIVPAAEKIIYFYSSGFFDVRDSGAGFTSNTVFSYWHEDDELVVKRVAFAHIKDIHENEGGSEGPSLNITDDEGEEFIMYLSDTAKDNRAFIKELKERWYAQKK